MGGLYLLGRGHGLGAHTVPLLSSTLARNSWSNISTSLPLPPGGRDVFNEKPSLEDMIAAEGEAGGAAVVLPRGVVIHTTKV